MSAGCPPRKPAVCAGIEERHAAELKICDVLEAIADSLPGVVDRRLCLWAGITRG